MDPGEQSITGTRDEHYNLISVLYHALHGAETIETYILDAEAAGDERLASFFREAQGMQVQLAERAKGMLGITEEKGVGGAPRMGDVPPEEGSPPDVPPEDVPRGVPPERTTGDLPADLQGGVPHDGPRTGDVSPGEPPVPTDVPSDTQRETPPPGEERPERRGDVPPRDTPREAPPPGEERPERRTQ